LGAQLLTLAQQVHDSAMRLEAHRALGATLFYLGAAASALTHLAQGMALYDPSSTAPLPSSLYRLKGALLLQQSADHHAEAQACFHYALDVARAQQARSLELRAAVSLSRLWQHQG
jgi:hypothetical protein